MLSLCIADENVWVATLGDGIHIFEANTKQKLTHWNTKDNVHVIHYCPSHACVVTLEDRNLRVFSAILCVAEHQEGDAALTMLYSVSLSCQSTLALVCGENDRDEIWTATQTGSQIVVFILNDRSVESVPDQCTRGGFRLRVIEPLNEAGEEDYVAISDGNYLEKWNILDRKKALEIDCHTICKELTDQESKYI